MGRWDHRLPSLLLNHRNIGQLRDFLISREVMGGYVELTVMRVVPIRPGLTSSTENIFKGIGWGDRALRDPNGTISPGCCILEETVPVLIT